MKIEQVVKILIEDSRKEKDNKDKKLFLKEC
jgi:hypothetical protein